MVKSTKLNVTNKIKLNEIKKIGDSLKRYYFILGILTFFAYSTTLSNGYNLDDELVTRNHPLTSQGIKGVKKIFTSSYYSDEMGYSYGYRPIVHLSFAIENEFFGDNSTVSHLVNVIIYILLVLLLFRFLIKLMTSKYLNLIFFAVLIFSIHPIHTEVVASIKNRDELLAFLFAILSGIEQINYLNSSRKWKHLIFSSLCFGLAILSKESIYPLIFITPLLLQMFKEVNLKALQLVTTSMVIPLCFITYDMDIKNIILLVITPFLWSTIIPYLFEIFGSQNLKFFVISTLRSQKFLILIYCIAVISIYLTSNYLIVFLVLILIYILILNYLMVGIILTSFLMIFLYFLFGDLLLFELLLSILLLIYIFEFDKKNQINSMLSIVIGSVIFLFLLDFFLNGFDFGIITRLFGFLILLFILKINKLLGLISMLFFVFGLFIIVFKLGNIEIPYILPSLFIISIIGITKLFFKFSFSFNMVSLSIFVLATYFSFITYLSFVNIKNEASNNQEKIVFIQEKKEIDKNRAINYVENTLVKSNSKSSSLATGVAVLGEYFHLMVFPYELSFYYGFSKVKTEDFKSLKVWVSLVIHLILGIFVIWNYTKRKFMFIGLFWYIVSILLFSNWIELIPGMVGERLAFTASAGFSIFIAGLVFWIKPDFNLKRPRIIELLVILVLMLFLIKTISRNNYWKDPITLMGNDIKHLQNSAQANNLYALNLMKVSLEESTLSTEQVVSMQKLAVKHFKRAIEIYPNFFNAWYDLSRVYVILNDNNNAIKSLKRVIILNKKFSDAYIDLLTIYETKNDRLNHLKYARIYFENIQDPESVIMIAKSFVANHKIDSAQIVLKRGLLKFTNNKRILSNIAELNSYIENKN